MPSEPSAEVVEAAQRAESDALAKVYAVDMARQHAAQQVGVAYDDRNLEVALANYRDAIEARAALNAAGAAIGVAPYSGTEAELMRVTSKQVESSPDPQSLSGAAVERDSAVGPAKDEAFGNTMTGEDEEREGWEAHHND